MVDNKNCVSTPLVLLDHESKISNEEDEIGL
jgi:hypothetical protein